MFDSGDHECTSEPRHRWWAAHSGLPSCIDGKGREHESDRLVGVSINFPMMHEPGDKRRDVSSSYCTFGKQ
jgi:hypothetical protein